MVRLTEATLRSFLIAVLFSYFMAQSTSLAEAGPNDQLVFSVVTKSREEGGDTFEFTPEYYPDRFTKVMEKELSREGQQCKGEDVSVKKFKNPDIHATGVTFAHQVSTLEDLHLHEGKVDLYTPISPNGGLEAYVKKVEVGEINGWNPHEEEWMFDYTMDLVSTGRDEYGNDRENSVVTNLLAKNEAEKYLIE